MAEFICFPKRLVEQLTRLSLNLIEISGFEFLPAVEMCGIAEHDAIIGSRMDFGNPMPRAAVAALVAAPSLGCALGNSAFDLDGAAGRELAIGKNSSVNKVRDFHSFPFY